MFLARRVQYRNVLRHWYSKMDYWWITLRESALQATQWESEV